MHNNLEKLDQFDANVYAVSNDQPDELKSLYDALQNKYPREDQRTINFLSDPNLELTEYMEMKNETSAFRGYGLLSKDGKTIFVRINDHWGEQLDQTLDDIKKHYNDLE